LAATIHNQRLCELCTIYLAAGHNMQRAGTLWSHVVCLSAGSLTLAYQCHQLPRNGKVNKYPPFSTGIAMQRPLKPLPTMATDMRLLVADLAAGYRLPLLLLLCSLAAAGIFVVARSASTPPGISNVLIRVCALPSERYLRGGPL